jgi:crotonobetainyl-CoA:carnitine CoA-transferase CaiB-like acyl-CoA transferase
MAIPRASQALSRFTVLDLTRVRSGPTCVRQLADWGANVIKIDALLEDAAGEQPGGPPWVRLSEFAPQQARHDTQPEGPEGS